jgi:hypothetical protein
MGVRGAGGARVLCLRRRTQRGSSFQSVRVSRREGRWELRWRVSCLMGGMWEEVGACGRVKLGALGER